jgi:GT2 family glycosyltransferase
VQSDIAVVIATRDRAKQLKKTLLSLSEQKLSGIIQVYVVDNGSVDNTRDLQFREWPGLDLVYLYEGVAGKSRALNRALEVVASNLVVFTDDDVTASPMWLAELQRASLRYPEAGIVCGPIVPLFPRKTPRWFRDHPDSAGFFGKFEPQTHEGPLPRDVLPFGANFAVRGLALEGKRFNECLGPSPSSGPVLGDDTDFVDRIRQRHEQCIFAPAATIFHHIAPSQIEPKWIFERAFHMGRATVALHRETNLVHERYGFVEHQRAENGQRQFERGGVLNYYCGQLFELHNLGLRGSESEKRVREALGLLEINSHKALLGQSALRFCKAAMSRVKRGEVIREKRR